MTLVSISLMTLWMVCALLGFTVFGLTNLLLLGAVTIEVLRPAPKR
jgi:hypothetical protein